VTRPLDLPDVTLHWDPMGSANLVVTHKKTGMTTLISAARLNAWLIRQLRNELVSPKKESS